MKELIEIDNLPEEDKVGYKTLSGLVMNQLGSIPAVGDTINVEEFAFEVVEMDGLRVNRVLVTRIPLVESDNSD